MMVEAAGVSVWLMLGLCCHFCRTFLRLLFYVLLFLCCIDWVLSHWVHFTVHSLDFLCLSVCILCFCFSYCIYVVLLSAQWGGPNGIEAWSSGLLFLQCCDTVGWVFWPIKPVPDMTYNVFGGTLNLAQFNSILHCIKEMQAFVFCR